MLAGLRAEEQFEAAVGQLAHLNALVESLHEAVTIVDTTGRIAYKHVGPIPASVLSQWIDSLLPKATVR